MTMRDWTGDRWSGGGYSRHRGRHRGAGTRRPSARRRAAALLRLVGTRLLLPRLCRGGDRGGQGGRGEVIAAVRRATAPPAGRLKPPAPAAWTSGVRRGTKTPEPRSVAAACGQLAFTRTGCAFRRPFPVPSSCARSSGGSSPASRAARMSRWVCQPADTLSSQSRDGSRSWVSVKSTLSPRSSARRGLSTVLRRRAATDRREGAAARRR